MVFQFEYEKDGQRGYLNINVTETGQTFNYSEISFGISGEAMIGWLPLQGMYFKQDLPRYFGSDGGRQYNVRVPSALKTLITPIDGENVLILEKNIQYFGDYDAYNYRTPLDLYIYDNGVRKNVCSILLGYEEIDDPEHPGQMIPSVYSAGLYSFATPVAEFPNPRQYVGNLTYSQKLPSNSYNESSKPCYTFWMIKVHDNIVGSVTYGEDFDVLVISYTFTGNSSDIEPIYIDARLLKGAEIKPIPSKSTTQGNTPSGFRGDRDNHSDSDTESHIGLGFREMFSGGEHGVRVKQLDHDQVQVFYNCLWQQDLWQNFQQWKWNPIGCVLGLQLMPCDPEYVAENASNIKLGGYEMKYEDGGLTVYSQGKSCANYREIKTKIFHPKEYTGSFLDWGDNTSISFRLPFIGTVPIDTSKVMNGGIFAKYNIDFYTGNCLVQIYTIPEKLVMGSDTDWDEDYDGCLCMIAQYAGNCAHKIAVSGNDYGAGQVVGAIVDGISSAASIATGIAAARHVPAFFGQKGMMAHSIAGGINGIVGAIGSGFMSRHNISIIPASPNADTLGMMIPALIIERPMDITPLDENGKATSYENFGGRPAASGGQVKDYKDFDMGDGVFIKGIIHADTLYATDSEKDEIEAAFAKGVYL